MSALDGLADALDARLADADAEVERAYPGDAGTRQPVHTVYVPADRVTPDLPARWGEGALEVLEARLGTPERVAGTTGIEVGLAARVLPLVRDKLAREPIEDLRVDYEDGLVVRGAADVDAAVDAAVDSGAQALLAMLSGGTAPPFTGIRTRSLEAATRRRSLRTLDLFLARLAAAGPLPDGFVVTLPKVTAVEQVGAMVSACEHVETAHGLAAGSVRFEIQVETPQSILTPDGRAAVGPMISAAQGRCTGLHYGTYDYSASLGIAAGEQSMEHPAADHAKSVMQVAAAGTGVRLSDGSTNVLPVGEPASVDAALALHARLVRRSLGRGFYQGWDLHPAQLTTRYLATFAFYRAGLDQALARLRAYSSGSGSGAFLDEPATARALAWFVARGADCGAVTAQEVVDGAGLDLAALSALAHPARPGP